MEVIAKGESLSKGPKLRYKTGCEANTPREAPNVGVYILKSNLLACHK